MGKTKQVSLSGSNIGKTKQFSMPVVLQNLPPPETLNQVVDSLNCLSGVIDEAFDSISTQVSEERKKIQEISKRVEDIHKKAIIISKQRNKATTVYCAPKFPADKLPPDEPLIALTEPTTQPQRPKYRLTLEQRSKQARATNTLTLLHSLTEKTTFRREEKPEGLGRLPSWLESVSDCLLFNTNENPYMKYSSTDNLRGEGGIDREKASSHQLQAAPITITQGPQLMEPVLYDVMYQPKFENAPVYTIPEYVPDLAGIAQDIQWNSGTETKSFPTLAPSANQKIPMLDAVPYLEIDDTETVMGEGTAGPPPQPDAPPPPPPPEQEPDNPPPPPQPKPEVKEEAKPKPKAPPSDGARQNLLAQIRAGSKLKDVKKQKRKERKAPPKPMNLMDHLKQKLSRRNALMRGHLEASAAIESKELDLPPIDEIKKAVIKEPERRESKDDALGLKNLPPHMRESMMFVDDEAGTESDDGFSD